jgi:hypothetical protein
MEGGGGGAPGSRRPDRHPLICWRAHRRGARALSSRSPSTDQGCVFFFDATIFVSECYYFLCEFGTNVGAMCYNDPKPLLECYNSFFVTIFFLFAPIAQSYGYYVSRESLRRI